MTTSTRNPSTACIDAHLLETTILPTVFKPGRYLGIEQGAFRKPFETAKATMALCFPDVYEIGASSYAIKLLYSVVNNHPDYMCDRVYAPAQDMRDALKAHNMPLYGVETKRPVAAFDFVAISLQYELNYTTVLGLLESAQIPLRSENRKNREDLPLILGGGPGCSNPMPMAAFFDGFMVGDGEDLLIEVMDLLTLAKAEGWSRHEKLENLAKISGIYVPNYNTHAYKRVVEIAERHIDIAPLIPAVEAIHDRVTVEARRGCDRMCRFCHPAFINLPARENNVEVIKEKALKQLAETGYEECSLLSLSIADYSEFKHLVTDVAGALNNENVSLSLSSQRADRFSVEVAEAVQTVRKSTLTFAPEAGTNRLRDVINKNLSDAEIIKAVTTAFRSGWNKVKLYYMIGLPTETYEDLDGIVNMVQTLRTTCQLIQRTEDISKRKLLELNITFSNFVPKPHTPFQWHAQETVEMLYEKMRYLKEKFRFMKGVKASFTTPTISKLEAVISKGGVELADALELAYQKGAYLDAWEESQPFKKWFEALEELGIDPEAYTRDRLTHPSEPLPWDAIKMGLDKDWLTTEWERSIKGASTKPCFDECSVCGVCGEFNVWPSFTSGSAGGGLLEAEVEKPKIAKSEKQLQQDLPPIQKVQFTMGKAGHLRFVSHLDWMRMIQRALRRANLPLAYSQGFNPKPRIGLSPALPLFVEGLNELVEVDFCKVVDVPKTMAQLNQFLPVEAQITKAEAVAVERKSIDALLHFMHYQASTTCMNPQQESMIRERIQTVLQEPHWLVAITSAKRGTVSSLDLKPWVSEIKVHAVAQQQTFTISFTVERANPLISGGTTWVKPQWLLDFLTGGLPQEAEVSSTEETTTLMPLSASVLQPLSWLVKRTGLAVKMENIPEVVTPCLDLVTS
jgi:radical SAM-linked protein